MATSKEIKEHLEKALKEIGTIQPWFDKEVDEWIFSHPAYPVEYGGETPREVIKNYPKYLKEFIKQRLNNNLDNLVEKKTTGHGGMREGAGRPIGKIKEPTIRVTLPSHIAEIALWISKHPESIAKIKNLIR